MIIAVLGRAGSGKTTVGRQLGLRLDCEVIDVSELVETLTKTSKKKQGRSTLQTVHLEQKDHDWLAKPLIEKAKPSNETISIVVGIREPYLLHRLNAVDQVVVFSIEVDSYTRYSRLCERDTFISVEDFQKNDKGDELLGLDITLESAHYTIDGAETINTILNTIEVILFENGIRSNRTLGEA